MAKAVEAAIEADEHLLVQAGTGTGKSLAYLIPAVAHAVGDRQAGRRGHRHAGAAGPDRRPGHAPAGRGGRADHRAPAHLRAGQGPAQLPVPAQARRRLPRRRGGAVLRRPGRPASPAGRAWARRWSGCASGPTRPSPVTATSSSPASASAPGARCRSRRTSASAPSARWSSECFVERARDAAKDVDIVVTNHSFMAIDSFEGRQMLPEHDLLVIDEAHELVDRVTSTVTDELSASMIATAAKRAGRLAETEPVTDACDPVPGHPRRGPRGPAAAASPTPSRIALARVRDTCRAVQTELKPAEPRGQRRRPAGGPGRDRRDLRERRAGARGARARRGVGQP